MLVASSASPTETFRSAKRDLAGGRFRPAPPRYLALGWLPSRRAKNKETPSFQRCTPITMINFFFIPGCANPTGSGALASSRSQRPPS